jgi:Acetyltransferases
MNRVVFTLRNAEPQDYDSLCHLFDEVDRLHREQLSWLFKAPEGSIRDSEYLFGLMQDPSVLLAVAVAGKELVGLVHAFVRDNPPLPVFVPRRYVVIDSIVVSEAWKHHGIGRMLAEKVEIWAKEQGANSIELNVFEFNQDARLFYETLGYQTLSRKMSKGIDN